MMKKKTKQIIAFFMCIMVAIFYIAGVALTVHGSTKMSISYVGTGIIVFVIVKFGLHKFADGKVSKKLQVNMALTISFIMYASSFCGYVIMIMSMIMSTALGYKGNDMYFVPIIGLVVWGSFIYVMTKITLYNEETFREVFNITSKNKGEKKADSFLNSKEMICLRKKLDSMEEDMHMHHFELESENVGFLCKEICFFNQCVHEKLGESYESWYNIEFMMREEGKK